MTSSAFTILKHALGAIPSDLMALWMGLAPAINRSLTVMSFNPVSPRRLLPQTLVVPVMASVLVIEDESSLRQIFVRMLSGDGHMVSEARDGQEALRLLKSHEPDVSLTDIVMPNADGIEVIAANRRRKHPAKLIAMSGVGGFGPDYLKTALELGADYALKKPFRYAELRAAILACLGAAAAA